MVIPSFPRAKKKTPRQCPLSLMRGKAKQNGLDLGVPGGENHPVAFNGIPRDMIEKIVVFCHPDKTFQPSRSLRSLPRRVAEKIEKLGPASIGRTCTLSGTKLVLIDVYSGERYYFLPAKLVDVGK